MNTPYTRGARRERELARLLSLAGFQVVRSAGSAGPLDLVALRPGMTWLIQVKSCQRLPSAGRRRRAWAGLAPVADLHRPDLDIYVSIFWRVNGRWYVEDVDHVPGDPPALFDEISEKGEQGK